MLHSKKKGEKAGFQLDDPDASGNGDNAEGDASPQAVNHRAQETIDEKRDLASFLSFLSFFTQPSNEINFSFLSCVYLFMTALSMALYVAEKVYLVSAIKGYYIVLMPFAPCAVWALTMRGIAMTKQLFDADHPAWEAAKKNR
jgi:hypothetical protein